MLVRPRRQSDQIDTVAGQDRNGQRAGEQCTHCVVYQGGDCTHERAKVALAQGATRAANSDVVRRGASAVSENVADTNDSRSAEARTRGRAPFNLPVLIHIGQSFRR